MLPAVHRPLAVIPEVRHLAAGRVLAAATHDINLPGQFVQTTEPRSLRPVSRVARLCGAVSNLAPPAAPRAGRPSAAASAATRHPAAQRPPASPPGDLTTGSGGGGSATTSRQRASAGKEGLEDIAASGRHGGAALTVVGIAAFSAIVGSKSARGIGPIAATAAAAVAVGSMTNMMLLLAVMVLL